MNKLEELGRLTSQKKKTFNSVHNMGIYTQIIKIMDSSTPQNLRELQFVHEDDCEDITNVDSIDI